MFVGVCVWVDGWGCVGVCGGGWVFDVNRVGPHSQTHYTGYMIVFRPNAEKKTHQGVRM